MFRTILMCALFLLSSCSSIHPIEEHINGSDDTSKLINTRAIDKIAVDFVSALIQIPGYAPHSTTIQFERAKTSDAFTRAVRDQLELSGYGVRWIAAQGGDNLFQYRREIQAAGIAGKRTQYELAIGDVELRRTYMGVEEETAVQPVTPLYIRGADASKVVLNDAAFASQKPQSNQNRLHVSDEVSPLPTWARKEQIENPLTMPLVALPAVKNVFELGGSNHSDSLAGHSIVAERILTFSNDSLRLGAINKQIVHALVSDYIAATDVFSVLGCSMGPTELKGGNAALALGRASRVTEALLFAGVAPDKILDEGCWAGDSGSNTLPKRGVVLTLNRRI
ncbi:MAG: hypothetical protein AB8B84_03585 [Granulosicoccus sp.]